MKVEFSKEVKRYNWGKDNSNWMPVLEVLVDGEVKGYLSPFRFYRFQVSGTFDGVRDLGSSQVIEFGTYVTAAKKNLTYEMIRGQIALAMTAFCNYIGAPMPDMFPWWDESEGLPRFIVETVQAFGEYNG